MSVTVKTAKISQLSSCLSEVTNYVHEANIYTMYTRNFNMKVGAGVRA